MMDYDEMYAIGAKGHSSGPPKQWLPVRVTVGGLTSNAIRKWPTAIMLAPIVTAAVRPVSRSANKPPAIGVR
jgi:hypothetical protein